MAMSLESQLSAIIMSESVLHARYLDNTTHYCPIAAQQRLDYCFVQKHNIGMVRVFVCSSHTHVSSVRQDLRLARRQRLVSMLRHENGFYWIRDIAQNAPIVTRHVFLTNWSFLLTSRQREVFLILNSRTFLEMQALSLPMSIGRIFPNENLIQIQSLLTNERKRHWL